MRDLIDDPHPGYTAAMMDDLMGRKARQEPAGGDLARSAPGAAIDPFKGTPRPSYAICDVAWGDAFSDLALIWNAAVAEAGKAAPLPVGVFAGDRAGAKTDA